MGNDCDTIRKRPGMYLGDVANGPDLMAKELATNAANEALSGHATRIEVILNPDGSCTVRDNGRGIPTDMHPILNQSAAELVMTSFAHVGKFQMREAKGMTGIGAVVVTALSKRLTLRVWREGKEFSISFADGAPEGPIRRSAGTTSLRGTEIIFLPSAEIFPNRPFDCVFLAEQLSRLELPTGAELTLFDNRSVPGQKISIPLSGHRRP